MLLTLHLHSHLSIWVWCNYMSRCFEEKDIWDPQEMGTGWQRRLSQVFFCRVGDEMGHRICGNMPSGRHCLVVSRGCLLELVVGIKWSVRRGRLRGPIVWDADEMGTEKKEKLQSAFYCRSQYEWDNGIRFGNKRMLEGFHRFYLFPYLLGRHIPRECLVILDVGKMDWVGKVRGGLCDPLWMLL